jgi:hypothetical protein
MKKVFLTSVLLMTFGSTFSQIGVGAQLNYMRYGGGTDLGFIGLGVNGTYVVNESIPVRLSINFGLPQTTEYTESASALSSTTVPQNVTYTYSEKVSLLNVWIDAQKYFGNGDHEDGGVYGLLGIGYTSAGSSFEVGSVDRTRYQVFEFEDSRVGQLGLRGAIGYDVGLDFGNIFAEAGINISANQQNDQIVAVNLPSFLFGNVGVRFWLD